MTPNQIVRLERLVDEKGWKAFDFLAHPERETVDAISRMFQGLPNNEIDLTLDLLDDYIIIKEYTNYARELMIKIRDVSEDKSICITPIVDYKSTRTKSGHSLHYDMTNFTSLISRSKIIFRDDPKSHECQNHIGIHVSVDDFIGTGSQFLSMIENILKEGKRKNITHVAAICIQEKAKKLLEDKGYNVISINVPGKGLERLSRKRKVPKSDVVSEYECLEQRTACSTMYNLGRDQAEALITMKATPNNTLPVFWFEGDSKWPAPFPRPRR